MNLLRFVFLILLIQCINSLKVLFVPTHSSASHTKSMYPLATTFVNAGHEVVMWQISGDTSQKVDGSLFENRHLIAQKNFSDDDTRQIINQESYIWTKRSQSPFSFFAPWKFLTNACKHVLDSPETLEQFMATVNQKWDVILADNVFCACGYLAAQLNGAMWIDYSTSVAVPVSQEYHGVPYRASFVPSYKFDGGSDLHNFADRLRNTYDITAINLIFFYLDYLIPNMLNNQLSDNLPLSRFRKLSTFAISSLATEMEVGKPISRTLLEIDTDCPKYVELAEPYKSFVEASNSKGTILLAFGHLVQWDTAPENVKNAFYNALMKLKTYRIIWQYSISEKGSRPNISAEHIMVAEWIPQHGILYHPKTVAFISHMGAKSLREAVCAKVPIVAMPLFAEQFRNSAVVRHKRIGVYLSKIDLNEESVTAAIESLLENKEYKRKIEKLQNQLDDKIMNSGKYAEWWISFAHRKPKAINFMKPKLTFSSLVRFHNDVEICSFIVAIMFFTCLLL